MTPDVMSDLAHIRTTFDGACRAHPDLMERYVILLSDAETAEEQLVVMRRALRETIKQRYPLREAAA